MAPHILLGEPAVTRIIIVSSVILAIAAAGVLYAAWRLVRGLMDR